MNLKLSVNICTYNRAAYLTRSLDSLFEQTWPASQFEILVIDNNSTDQTHSICERYVGRCNVRYIFEERQGLSRARNRGLEESAAALVAFLDDDAIAAPSWAESIVQTFAEIPTAAAVGGPVIADWQGYDPYWLPDPFRSLYTELDYGGRRLNLTERGGILQGANMAFRKQALLDAGGFAHELGRKGKLLISGEESLVLDRFRKTGLGIWYEPGCAVRHLVLPERRCEAFFFKRMRYDGHSQVMVDLLTGRLHKADLKRRLLYEMKMLVREYASTCLATGTAIKKRNHAKALYYRRLGRIRCIISEM